MAYWTEKNGKKWLYHKDKNGKYITPIDLGFVSDAEADVKVAQWKIDNGKSPAQATDRTTMSAYHQYLKWMVEEDYSEKTINDAPCNLLPFIHTVPTIGSITEKKVREWEQALIDWRYKKGPKATLVRKLSIDTRMHRMRAIKSFLNWMVTQKIMRSMPCRIEIEQGRRDAGTDLAERTQSFLDAIAPRSKVLSHLIFFGGLRVTNALQIRGEWIDHLRMSIKLPREVMKNADGLELFLPAKVMAMLPKDATGPIFASMTAGLLYYDWVQTKKKLGIKGRFRIHDGRVSAASEVWRREKNVKLLKERFGWRDDRTAMHYVKVTEREHREAAERITFGG